MSGPPSDRPVWPANFPDPMVLADPAGGFWAYATTGNSVGGRADGSYANVQALRSDDLEHWTPVPDPLPAVAAWSSPGKVWAPEVMRFAPDRWVMYYTTRAPDPERQCVSVAVATSPGGPYVDTSDAPLLDEVDAGGSIDAHPFRTDDGRRFLFWKNDGNAVGVDTWVSAAPLSDDGRALTGPPQRIIQQDLPWEGELVEGPNLIERGGRFHLFYSGNGFTSPDYAVGHAVADHPLGPYVKDAEPVLRSDELRAGPGHNSLVEVDGRVWMGYHAWLPGRVAQPPGRLFWIAEVLFDGDRVSVLT